MDKKEQTRLRVQRYRERKALPNSVTVVRHGVTEDNEGLKLKPGYKESYCVTPECNAVTQDVTQYPALLYTLADPGKRAKLRRICEELSGRGQLRNVYYGAGETSVPFDVVNEYMAVLT